jgi:hypothetical protein
MLHHQREFENVPETRQTGPLRTEGVPVDSTMRRGEDYLNHGENPVQGQPGSTSRPPGQVVAGDNPSHDMSNAARDQTYDPQSTWRGDTSRDCDTSTDARHHPFTSHHHTVTDQPAAVNGAGTNAPTTSYVDSHSAHRAGVPAGTGVTDTTGMTSAANTTNAGVQTGSVKPTTGEKIRGTVKQIVGELEGNPTKAAEGKAMKEGWHPAQTGP